MHSAWFRSNFLRLSKFPQIKEGAPNFLGTTNSAETLKYLVPLLYFNFKSLKNPDSSSFIRSQSFLHHSGEPFSDLSNFPKLKSGDLISLGQRTLQNGWIIWSPLLYLNFKSFNDPNSSSLIRFQRILHDSGIIFSDFSNFRKLQRGDLISWWKPILQNCWINCFLLLYFNFKSFNEPNSSSFVRFPFILH